MIWSLHLQSELLWCLLLGRIPCTNTLPMLGLELLQGDLMLFPLERQRGDSHHLPLQGERDTLVTAALESSIRGEILLTWRSVWWDAGMAQVCAQAARRSS